MVPMTSLGHKEINLAYNVYMLFRMLTKEGGLNTISSA